MGKTFSGAKHMVKSLAKGDIGGWWKGAGQAFTLGAVDTGIDGKKIKANGAGARAELHEDARDAAKRRKALFETEGGVLGQEVGFVDQKKRGNIFGN